MADSRNRRSPEAVRQAITGCLSRVVGADQTLLVGFSGGLDSMVLLHGLWHVLGGARHRLTAMHVHHGLSPNAGRWAEFCAESCNRLGVPLRISHVHVNQASGRGLEAEARCLRAGALLSATADWIVLGHHANDQAETLLHNLLRGTGVRGAAAMQERHGRFLRPMLGLTRDDLRQYAGENRLRWIEDESNLDNRFTRNFLRQRILPELTARFPRAVEQIAAAAARFGEANQLLDELARCDLQGNTPRFPLPLDLIEILSEPRAGNLLRAMLCWHGEQAPPEQRLKEFLRQLRQAGADRHPRLDLPGYSLVRKRRHIHFETHA